jgi:hypothetical protein
MKEMYITFGIMFLVLGGLVVATHSLAFGRVIMHEEMENKFGENFISTNCDGFADVFDCDVYNEKGEFLGRYHKITPWGYFIDKEGARKDVKIIKLEEIK